MKFSSTYYKLMAVAAFGLLTAILAAIEHMPTISAVAFACTFVCWYGGVMLPIHEKYRKGYKKNKGSIEL